MVGFDDERGPAAVFLLDERELVLARFLREEGAAPVLQFVRRRALPAETFQEGALGGPLREPAEFQEVVAELQQAAELAAGEPIARAALVLPDRWLRLTFAELEQVPGKPQLVEEALRFKLRKQVPFRVEELRVRGWKAGIGSGGASRYLIGFGVEHVLAQLENSFRSAAIHVGAVTNESLGAAGGIARQGARSQGARSQGAESQGADPQDAESQEPASQGDQPDAFLLLVAHPDGYSVLAHAPEGPVLFRYKGIDPELEPAVFSRLAVRDLRLTRSFIEERALFGAERTLPHRALMLAAEEEQDVWRDRLKDGLGLAAQIPDGNGVSGAQATGVDGAGVELAVRQALPMLGASLMVRT